ncbi:MAG: virulence protein, partial [Firmicutes bacterium]|nr:virulence protein [Bacillota bacterium]
KRKRLTLELPADTLTPAQLENLEKLIASKATLIKKAVGADKLAVTKTDDKLQFAWFPYTEDADEVNAYSTLVLQLCKAAKEQKRVTAKEKSVDNEKFAFRVFLIRLGFVGDDYKKDRKILLRNLSGNSAFKNGAPPKKEDATDE